MVETRETHQWHSLPINEALSLLDSQTEGLSHEEAGKRLADYGHNALPAAPTTHPFLRFLAQFNSALIYFLLAAALAAALLGHGIDAIVILIVVLINALVGYVQEGKAQQALNAIKDMIAPHAQVLRDGQREIISVTHLVPGDIVMLEAGDKVPADMRLIKARGLLIDEAPLTGESVPVEKHEAPAPANAAIADQPSMAFSGTLVSSGQAMAIVTATGQHTQIGQISRLLQSVKTTATPLLRQINGFAHRFTWVVMAGALALFLFAVFARGFDWVDALIAVVALSVGLVPEGLPAVITITLAIGVQRMAARNAIIRHLPAVETLGATSVICSDKTGTLTRNEMTVRQVMTDTVAITVGGVGYAPEGELRADGADDAATMAAASEIIRCGLMCNDARLRQEENGQWKVDGDPMEGALIALAMKAGLSPEEQRLALPRLDEIPFDAAYRYMATLHHDTLHDDSGGSVIYIKGAPEAIMAISGARPQDWEERIARAADQGERLLGFAMKRITSGQSRISFEDLRENVVFLGLMGFIDPPREEARAAIAECHSAGITVKMITGDHLGTAIAIARQLGISDAPHGMNGTDLEHLSDEDLARQVVNVDVFARSSPEHKLRIVRALQSNGLIVAMTGDGVNDAPSLKQADVGTAMGQKGTEAAKEASSMVLLDDNFASIVAAVREGRTVYDNIRKVIAWTLPTNGGETLAVIAAIFAGFALPMTATQILWINLVLAVTLGLVLAFEPPEPGTMQRRPRSSNAPLLSPFMLWRVALVSVLMAILALGLFFYALNNGRDVEIARTMVVNGLIVAEIFYLFSVRYLHMQSITWRGAMGTPAVLAAIAIVIGAQLLFTYAPFMHSIFESRPLTLADSALILGSGMLLFLLLEVEKLVMRRLGWFEELN